MTQPCRFGLDFCKVSFRFAKPDTQNDFFLNRVVVVLRSGFWKSFPSWRPVLLCSSQLHSHGCLYVLKGLLVWSVECGGACHERGHVLCARWSTRHIRGQCSVGFVAMASPHLYASRETCVNDVVVHVWDSRRRAEGFPHFGP